MYRIIESHSPLVVLVLVAIPVKLDRSMKFPLTQTLFEEIKTFIWSTIPIDYARLETLVHQAATFLSVWSQDCARVVFFFASFELSIRLCCHVDGSQLAWICSLY